MQKKSMSFSPNEWKIVRARILAMPSHIKLSIGGMGSFDKSQLLTHIDERDEIGQLVVKMHFNYLRLFKKEASGLP